MDDEHQMGLGIPDGASGLSAWMAREMRLPQDRSRGEDFDNLEHRRQ
jgi:hypothetical protein